MWFPAPTVRLLLLQFVAAATEQTALNGWYQCSDCTFSDAGSSTGQNAECAMYNAPLCHSGICETSASVDSTIDIFAKRLPASNGNPDLSNVWLLQGGPGYSSTTLESTMKQHTQLEGMVNVYTMDHRGTGRSTRLDCVASQITTTGSPSGTTGSPSGTTGSPSGTTINPSEVAACAKDLEYKYGNLSSFSMTSAATDIAMFISKYTNGKNTIVYGVSYGTALVERLMHLAPATVTGYALDGIATTPGTSSDKFPYISFWDTDFGEVRETFLGLCKEDKACTAHFTSGNPAATLERVINDFDKDPNSTCSQLMTSVSAGQKNEPPSFALRRALGLLLPDSTLRALIPPVIYRLNRCAPDDISVLAQFVTSLNALAQTKTHDEAYKSMLLYYLIVFSETWETPTPTPSNLVMETRFVDVKILDGGFYEDGGGGIYKLNALYCAFSKEKSETCNNFDVGNYDSSAIVYERDGHWNKSAVIPSQASVLLLSGRLDPQTPHKYAEYLLEVLEGDNKELIAFDYASHGTIMNTQLVEGDPYSDTCAMKVLASYVKNGGDLAKFDKSCVDEMPGFNMVIRAEDLYSCLSVDDAYDGVYNESLSSQ